MNFVRKSFAWISCVPFICASILKVISTHWTREFFWVEIYLYALFMWISFLKFLISSYDVTSACVVVLNFLKFWFVSIIHLSLKDCSFLTYMYYFYVIIYRLKIFLTSYSAKTPLGSMVGTGRLPSLTLTSCVIFVSMEVQPESRRWLWWE